MNKKILFLSMTLVMIAIILSGCSENDNALSGLTYQNSQYEFGLNPPEGWTTDENDATDAVRFYGPTLNEFAVNFGVSEPLSMSAGETLPGIYQIILETYENELENFTHISNQSRTVNGMSAYEIEYSYTMFGFDIFGKQVLVEKNRKIAMLTYSALETSYETYLTDFEQSLGSFTMV